MRFLGTTNTIRYHTEACAILSFNSWAAPYGAPVGHWSTHSSTRFRFSTDVQVIMASTWESIQRLSFRQYMDTVLISGVSDQVGPSVG